MLPSEEKETTLYISADTWIILTNTTKVPHVTLYRPKAWGPTILVSSTAKIKTKLSK